MIRAISFNNITSSTTPSDNSALVRIMNVSSSDDDDTRDDETREKGDIELVPLPTIYIH